MRRTPRALILAGGTVALVTVTRLTVTRRRVRASQPSRRPSLHLVPAIAAIGLSAGIIPDDLPGDWGFLSGFTSFISGLFNWVGDAIRAAVQWSARFILGVVKAFEWAFDQFRDNILFNVGELTTQVFGLAQGAIELGTAVTVGLAQQGRDLLAQIGNLLEHTATEAFELLKPYVDGLLAGILEPAADAIETILRSLLGPAWDFLQMLIELGSNGIGVLIGFAADPIGYVWGLISNLVNDAIDATIGGIADTVELIQSVWDILTWLASHAADLTVEALKLTWDLWWFVIQHADDVTIDALNAIFNPSWETLRDSVVAEAESQMSGAENFVASIFGLD